MISQNQGGLPIFLADLGVAVKDGIERYGLDGFHPGDEIVRFRHPGSDESLVVFQQHRGLICLRLLQDMNEAVLIRISGVEAEIPRLSGLDAAQH